MRETAVATVALLSIGALATDAAGPALAQSAEKGETLYRSVRRTCHGPTARGMASFPKLAGAEADYVVMRLGRHRAGETVDTNSALMRPHAAKLSDEDIADLAAYVSGLE